MSDADIARQSSDAEGYLIIDGDGDAALSSEEPVQEDLSYSVQKVGDDDGSPKRQAVNMDEIADLLNEGIEDQEPDQPDSNGLDHEGEVIVEDGIAEVKVEGVEAAVSIQWPGGDDGEGTKEVDEAEDTASTEGDDDQQREEAQQQEEPVLIEVNGEFAQNSLIDVEPVDEEKPVDEGEPDDDQPQIDDTPVVIDQAPEIIVDTSEIIDDTPEVIDEPEIDDTPVIIDEPQSDGTLVDEPEIDDTPVIIDAPESVEIEVNSNDVNGEAVVEDLSPAGNVAVDVTLGQEEREEEKRREEPTEDTTENEPISRDRGQSHRLDSSKFSKYNKSTDDPSEDEAPKSKTTGSKRLDMSRFALFQQQSGDGTDGPPKKNFTIKPVTKSPRFGSQGISSTDQSNKCLNCDKRVYPMDKISADGKPFHKSCFRCAECKKTLTLGNYAALNSVIYCKPHFTQLFKLHGNYNTGFSQGMRTSPHSSSDGHFEFDMDRQGAMEEIAATEAQTTESTPVTLEQEGLVRSSDTVEEQMASSGGTKSILEQFNKGNVSNVEMKRTIDSENVQVKSLEDYHPPPKEEDEVDTHIKPQDMIDTDRDQGQTAESEPQHLEGVVQGGYTEEVTRSSEGLKNLKSMWEKGGVSNIQTAQKEKIEVRSLEDVQESTSRAVAENVPEERRSDVMAGDVQEEDPGISSGLAQRIRAQFEQGKVSNIEAKSKPELERAPGSLEDYSQGDMSQSVSESTPQRRDDVIRSDVPLEEQAKAAEGTRSLLSRWEKGEVEHAEVRPGEGVEDPKTLKGKGEYAVSEPQVREDLVRESDPVDEEIPEGLARNISQTIEGSNSPTDAEFSVEIGVTESLESEPKRLPEDDQDEEPQFEVNVEVNGNVSPTENGHGDESTPNGHYENEDEGALLDSSAEIKAARAAADDEEDQSSILVESR